MDDRAGDIQRQAIAASTWSDALDACGIAGALAGLAWRSGTPPMAGRAVTVREAVGPLGSVPRSAFDVAGILGAAGPGQILVVSMDGAEVSTCGGLAARAAAARGIEGVLIDGGCRDLAEIRATGLKVASRHVTPLSGKGRARVVSLNEPVPCGGLTISTGDYVVADETGAVVVPAARFEEVLKTAADLHRRDEAFQRAIDSGESFGQIARALDHL